MEYQRFGDTVLARFDRGEELTAALRRLALEEKISLGHVSALGATDDFTVGVYDVDKREYHALDFTGPHEIVSLTGTVDAMGGEYYSHLHMSAANAAGAVVGGHLNRCVISATCELVLTVLPGAVDRRKDEAVTGLNLLFFENGKKL